MSRTKGAYDLRKRKGRKDLGKKRKLYNGKPVKKGRRVNGKFTPYKTNREKGSPVKVWFQQIKPMSKEGYKKWNKKARLHLDRTIKPFVGKPVFVDPIEISTPKLMGEMSILILQFPGTFNFMMPSASKSSRRVSYKKKAVVKIIETEGGLHATVSNYSMMRHYWFFRNE